MDVLQALRLLILATSVYCAAGSRKNPVIRDPEQDPSTYTTQAIDVGLKEITSNLSLHKITSKRLLETKSLETDGSNFRALEEMIL